MTTTILILPHNMFFDFLKSWAQVLPPQPPPPPLQDPMPFKPFEACQRGRICQQNQWKNLLVAVLMGI